ncbi:hypothetical protein [Nostoc sp. UIC 10630]|uniref:hypothetical protein n=1 Tax=Nostoc sp. UIC 10630 TaxID=2100146 RepID=UPI0013D49032|nr:hypothetical protein [Nostoc sp. UIC 10630]NEU78687.1 hypothetical protein [Nostoc sp. UIC 10630]
MKYNREILRQLLTALTDPELYESLDNFPSVRNQFSDNQQKYLKVETILNHFETRQNGEDEEGFPKFLEVIKRCNNTAYKNYVKRLESSEDKEISSLSDLKKGVNLDTKLIDELTNIFPEQDDLFWQCFKQVYQDFLWQLSQPDLELEPDNLSGYLLLQLEDWPEKTIILEFIPRLLAYLS